MVNIILNQVGIICIVGYSFHGVHGENDKPDLNYLKKPNWVASLLGQVEINPAYLSNKLVSSGLRDVVESYMTRNMGVFHWKWFGYKEENEYRILHKDVPP